MHFLNAILRKLDYIGGTMPNLSAKTIHKFWKEYDDPSLYRVIAFLEGVEDWTLDGHPEVEKSIDKLGEVLENIGNIDLQQEAAFVELVANIKSGRGLRILMCLDMAYPGAAAKVLMHAEENSKADDDTAGLFLRRNVVFERLRLLSRVFSPDRLKLVQKALEGVGYE